MIQPWAYLTPQERETLQILVAFLDKRLAEQATIDWALMLKPEQRIERLAFLNLLNGPSVRNLVDPWTSAWRLIEESWSTSRSEERNATSIYSIKTRLREGDLSGATISALVKMVSPRLKVSPIDEWRWSYIKRPRKPKTVNHILSAGLTSGDLIDLEVLKLSEFTDIKFLESLANTLEAAVNHGLDIAKRLGWDDTNSFTGLGFLSRSYYTQPTRRSDGTSEPDASHRGIAPSVKLLHAVVARLAEIDPVAAQRIVKRWQVDGSSVFIRLWAAMARNRTLVSAEVVASFLTSLSDRQFWNLHQFPEISELRARRFSDLNAEAQNRIVARIKKGPPRNNWPKKIDTEELKRARLYRSLRELWRIEIGGGILSDLANTWLKVHSASFAEREDMEIDDDFPGARTVTRREYNSHTDFDACVGVERLKALEVALSTERLGWNTPAEHANDWINELGNAEKVLADFECANDGGDAFPKVWDRFGWAHRPHLQNDQAAQYAKVASQVLALLNQLSVRTLSVAIDGICAWLSYWQRHAAKLRSTLPIWLRLWPIAVEVTNQRSDIANEDHLSSTARFESEDFRQQDLETLNTPVGKLVGVFLAACPSIKTGTQAFAEDSTESQMRDIVIAADGLSGLIAKHRMIGELPYFLQADHDWANEHLITPLLTDDGAALALWQAVATRTHFTKVLKIIGTAMIERANDRRLDRSTRRGLVFSLVIESLHAFREGRDPAVPNPDIQQMLRRLDDEVRASAANAIQGFARELSAEARTNVPKDHNLEVTQDPAAVLFRSAIAPFLLSVWPQERSLATPGVSSELAELPAIAGEAFSEAVETIAHFLVPFECWGLSDYGLYHDEGETNNLVMINDNAKAKALLKLLDLTIGMSEGAVVPYDLTNALDQIRGVAPRLANEPAFQRLETAARR